MQTEIVHGIEVQPVPYADSEGCSACVFNNTGPKCQGAPCIAGQRDDRTSVFFMAVSKEDPPPIPECPEAPDLVPGRKDDTGKLDITLLFDDCPHALEAVAEVLQWAITKKQPVPYARGSWQAVSDFQRRYRAAQYRHQIGAAKAVLLGGTGSHETARDAETGLLELAHIATDAIFQLEMAIRKQKGIE